MAKKKSNRLSPEDSNADEASFQQGSLFGGEDTDPENEQVAAAESAMAEPKPKRRVKKNRVSKAGSGADTSNTGRSTADSSSASSARPVGRAP
ncbi:MAG: hypothetical protein AAFP90_23255, partial [Planctomycetota bacterium]